MFFTQISLRDALPDQPIYLSLGFPKGRLQDRDSSTNVHLGGNMAMRVSKWDRQRTEPIKSVWLGQPPLWANGAQSCRRNSAKYPKMPKARPSYLSWGLRMVVDQFLKNYSLIALLGVLILLHFCSALLQTRVAFLWPHKKPTDKDMQVLLVVG